MKILLDTHVFLWRITGARELSAAARGLIGDGRNILYWSAASSWEVSIEYVLERLPLTDTPERFLPPEIVQNRIESLPIIDAHVFQAAQLPRHHWDPFDRMLVAQARVESFMLLSDDRQLSLYDVKVQG